MPGMRGLNFEKGIDDDGMGSDDDILFKEPLHIRAHRLAVHFHA